MHDLDRDLAVEPLVESEVHGRHAAVRDVREHAVSAVEHPPDEDSDESVTLDVMAASLRTPSPWIVQAGPDLEWSL